MTEQPVLDFAHTAGADRNRKRKAKALADAAAGLGVQPYELTVIHGTATESEARKRVRRAAGYDREPSVDTWCIAIGLLEGAARKVADALLCPECGYPVRYVVTELGRRVALDPFPHPDGTVWPITTAQGVRARVLGGSNSRPEGVDLFRQHTASCPSGPAGARMRLRVCLVCHLPLDAALAARDPTYTAHPCCAD